MSLIGILLALFKPKKSIPERVPDVPTTTTRRVFAKDEHGEWGDHIKWWDGGTKKMWGHTCPRPETGDLILVQMESGGLAIYEVTSHEHCRDPRDMFFADVKPKGYVGYACGFNEDSQTNFIVDPDTMEHVEAFRNERECRDALRSPKYQKLIAERLAEMRARPDLRFMGPRKNYDDRTIGDGSGGPIKQLKVPRSRSHE